MNFDNERNGGEHNTESNIVIGIPMPSGMIQLDSIRAGFHKSLLDAGITLAFTLQKVPFDSAGTRGRRGEVRLATSQGPDTPKMVQRINMETIEARSENVFLFILQKISLQLVFAVVMLAVIVAAFVFLYRNLRQQHRLAEIKNDLIANITHELKTPIATVSVAIEALKNFNAMHDTLRTKEYLDISGLELQRLNLLVDKVLKLSMFEQDKMELREETVDMKAVVGEVVDSMRLQLEKRGATVSTEYDGESFYVKGDRTHLQSVLYNLLDNAIKYTGRKPEIKIHLADKAGRLLLRVSDNGIGIAPQHQPKIFEKFFRVPHGNTHNIKGYGLGLSYVAEVVRLHGGKISVESEEGKGSTFSVWIG